MNVSLWEKQEVTGGAASHSALELLLSNPSPGCYFLKGDCSPNQLLLCFFITQYCDHFSTIIRTANGQREVNPQSQGGVGIVKVRAKNKLRFPQILFHCCVSDSEVTLVTKK